MFLLDEIAMSKLDDVINELVKFRDERDWSQFHDSKNLALAISIEAAELNELYLWKNSIEEIETVDRDRLSEELADVLAFSLLLAEKNNLDVVEILQKKIKKNASKYPVNKARGTAKKYSEL